MIKRLRRQLTALFTITTGLILTLVVIGILVISAREFNKKTWFPFKTKSLTSPPGSSPAPLSATPGCPGWRAITA